MAHLILLVDHSPAVRTLIRRYIESSPHLAVCGEASNGVEAIEKTLELSPDLIVMDFLMPGMNGVEAARELKHKMPHIPIVLFTAHEDALTVSEAIEAGISAVVPKCQTHKLVPEVMNILERRDRAA